MHGLALLCASQGSLDWAAAFDRDLDQSGYEEETDTEMETALNSCHISALSPAQCDPWPLSLHGS